MRITENQALKWDLCRFFAIAQNDKISCHFNKSCHTERSEVSIQKTKNRLLNAEFMDISLVSLTQYDNIIFAVSAPCKPWSPFIKARKGKMRKILCKF